MIFVVSVFVLMLPWGIRNYIVYDGLVIISPKYLDFRTHNTYKDLNDFQENYSVQDFMKSSLGFWNQAYTIKGEDIIISESERRLMPSRVETDESWVAPIVERANRPVREHESEHRPGA